MDRRLPDEVRDALAPYLRTQQIIVAALCVGVLLFAGIALAIGPLGGERPDHDGGDLILAVGGVIIAVAGLVASQVVPHLMRSGTPAVPDNETLRSDLNPQSNRYLGQLLTERVVSGATLEGPAFVAIVLYLFTGVVWLLAVPAVLLILLALLIPTMDRLESRIYADRMRADAADSIVRRDR